MAPSEAPGRRRVARLEIFGEALVVVDRLGGDGSPLNRAAVCDSGKALMPDSV